MRVSTACVDEGHGCNQWPDDCVQLPGGIDGQRGILISAEVKSELSLSVINIGPRTAEVGNGHEMCCHSKGDVVWRVLLVGLKA